MFVFRGYSWSWYLLPHDGESSSRTQLQGQDCSPQGGVSGQRNPVSPLGSAPLPWLLCPPPTQRSASHADLNTFRINRFSRLDTNLTPFLKGCQTQEPPPRMWYQSSEICCMNVYPLKRGHQKHLPEGQLPGAWLTLRLALPCCSKANQVPSPFLSGPPCWLRW